MKIADDTSIVGLMDDMNIVCSVQSPKLIERNVHYSLKRVNHTKAAFKWHRLIKIGETEIQYGN